MNEKLFNALQVHFIKLQFTISFLEDSKLPKNKISAIRGGMGEMLLRMNCIHDRQCEICDFKRECIVQKIIYSEFEKKPDFITTSGSVGYILECNNYQEIFKAREKLNFYLILFGKTITHFYQIFQAFTALGEQEGIGKYHAKFQIIAIKNMEKMSLLDNTAINMKKYVVHSLYDYVLFKKMFFDINKKEYMIIFDTPLALKYKNQILQEFQIEAILASIIRRIYMLNCFEGNGNKIPEYVENSLIPKILTQEHHEVIVARYSTRKEQKMKLKGIKGHVLLSGLTPDIMILLIVGELIHIGKYTSFGFGKFHLKYADVE